MDKIVKNLLFGLHSGIPLCCVLNYVLILYKHGQPVAKYGWDEYYYDGQIEDADYLLCPNCYQQVVNGEKEPVRVHNCKKGDKYLCHEMNEYLLFNGEEVSSRRYLEISSISYIIDLFLGM